MDMQPDQYRATLTEDIRNIRDIRSELLSTLDQARVDLERLSLELKTGTINDSHVIAERVVNNLHKTKEECIRYQEELLDLSIHIHRQSQS